MYQGTWFLFRSNFHHHWDLMQDREKATGTALEMARKEIQDLKVLISKNEEEKQAKDNRITDLENRVAELDRKLQEASQGEVNLVVVCDQCLSTSKFECIA
jgi:phage shock protein A